MVHAGESRMQAGAEAQGDIQRGSSVISVGALVSTGPGSPWSIVRIGQYNLLYLGNNQKITRTGYTVYSSLTLPRSCFFSAIMIFEVRT